VLRVLVVIGVLCSVRAAHAGRISVVITKSDDIEHVRDLTDPEIDALTSPFNKLGYHYTTYGMFLVLDFWRTGGEYVVYSGSSYIVLGDRELAVIGNPGSRWRYRLTPGLCIIAGLVELGIVTRRKRRANRTIALGAVMFGLAIVLYALGVEGGAVVAALLGTHHVVGAWFALEHLRRLEEAQGGVAAAEETPPTAEDEYRLPPAEPPRPSPQAMDQDPFRSPPRAPLAVVQVERPTSTPLAPDASAEPPKLLR
jgi:hypothetical protein